MTRVGFNGCENSRSLAGFADSVERSLNGGAHSWMVGFAKMAEVGGEVARADEQPIDAIDRGDGIDILQRPLRFDLDDHADLVVNALVIVLQAAVAAAAGRHGHAAHTLWRITC